MSYPPPPTYDETVEAVAACGIRRSAIKIIYDDELQSDVVCIADLGSWDDKKLNRLLMAIHPFYVTYIEREDQRMAYFSVLHREADRAGERRGH